MNLNQPKPPLSTVTEIGYVISAKDYLLTLNGLPSVRINDIITTEKGGRALVTNLDKDRLNALMLDSERPKPGTIFQKGQRGLLMPNATQLLGRAITPLGQPIDGKTTRITPSIPVDLDKTAPGIETREIISKQFITGITMVDILIPIGVGQRELMLGESRSGKTSFMLDLIIHQKGKNVICIYTAIGRSEVDVQRFISGVNEAGAADYTIILAVTSSQAAPLIYIAPSIAIAIAESFRDKGLTVLLILDDLGTHAKYLREIGLLSDRVPGRESYPADIFYSHSQLVERAGNFNENLGNGSITLIPVVETEIESFTNLIPTNVMSMTDGHLFFSSAIRAQGIYPAIDIDRSVTRVGRQTQPFIFKVLADMLRTLLANYHELERYSRFGSELTAESQLTIKRGTITIELLRQETTQMIDQEIQIMLLALIFTGFFDDKDVEFVTSKKQIILNTLKSGDVFHKIVSEIRKMNIDTLIKNLKDTVPILTEACNNKNKDKSNSADIKKPIANS